jgi:hypothetical protein
MMLTCPEFSQFPHIRHGFFGREGGVSEGVYASLNCGYGSGDHTEKVRKNRELTGSVLGAAREPLTCSQVHSAKVVAVTTPWEWKDSPEADAMVTDQPHIPLGILTADCLPVLFTDRKKTIIGAAHAGWKGAIGGVLEATIHAMQQLGAGEIAATIGPAIGGNSYEVGAEFVERFMQESATNSQFFKPSPQENSAFFDLSAYAESRLRAAGIAHIHPMHRDTLLDEKHFFSYRRTTLAGQKAYGRQISVIMLEK